MQVSSLPGCFFLLLHTHLTFLFLFFLTTKSLQAMQRILCRAHWLLPILSSSKFLSYLFVLLSKTGVPTMWRNEDITLSKTQALSSGHNVYLMNFIVRVIKWSVKVGCYNSWMKRGTSDFPTGEKEVWCSLEHSPRCNACDDRQLCLTELYATSFRCG